jgi:hypothetical protein
MFMYYPELNRAGSHGTSGVGFVIVLSVRYMSLITCGLAEDDAVGTQLTLRRLRGVICIMREVIDKVGLNRLLVPHQSPFPFSIQSSLLFSTTMPRTANTYTVPFEPICNGPGEFATAKERFNFQWFVKKRGSRVTPYLSFVDVYQRSKRCVADADSFEDLQLADFVDANKRWMSRWISFWCYLTCLSGFPDTV